MIKPGGLPIDENVVVYNVETMYNLYRAVHLNIPVTNKLVSIVGEIDHPLTVRVPLGTTVRSKSQVEISATDARTLGIKAPVRQSGDTAGSAPIALVGPKGVIYLDEGCIVAARHIHMCPADAAAAGLKDNDFVSVRVGNERGVVLDQVKIRVDESFTTEMHIDTDEANASQVKQDDLATIIF